MLTRLVILLLMVGLHTISYSEEMNSSQSGQLPLSVSAVGSSPSEEPTGIALDWDLIETVGTVEQGEEAFDWGISFSISLDL